MAKQILLPYGSRTELMQLFKTTYPTMRAALKFETNTPLAKKIRHTAIKVYGGVIQY